MKLFLSRLYRHKNNCKYIPINCYGLILNKQNETCECKINCKYFNHYLNKQKNKIEQKNIMNDYMNVK